MPFRSSPFHSKSLAFCLASGALALVLAGCSPVAAGGTTQTIGITVE